VNHRADEMNPEEPWGALSVLVVLCIGLGFLSTALARIAPQAAGPSTHFPSDVQLLNAESNPTLRFPISHSSYSWSMVKLVRVRASYGWLEITRDSVRYTLTRQTQATKNEDEDAGFDITRADIVDPKIQYNVVAFHARGKRNYIAYVAERHWDTVDSGGTAAKSVTDADSVYTPLILQAIQNFDHVVAEYKLQPQNKAAPPVVAQPVVTPPPEVKATPPAPPAIVLVAPSGAGENQTVQVNESPLTIRGVAMDNSGFPTVTINGAPAALRPKSAQAAEFWSDPITLKPGDNTFEIVATNSAQAKSKFSFVAQFTPKTAPPNPRALDKQDIISLLQGGVANSRIVELVKDRGLKFSPTADDLNDIRAAGGNEEVIQAIQQAAAPVR
jgi:hypothetical protein